MFVQEETLVGVVSLVNKQGEWIKTNRTWNWLGDSKQIKFLWQVNKSGSAPNWWNSLKFLLISFQQFYFPDGYPSRGVRANKKDPLRIK